MHKPSEIKQLIHENFWQVMAFAFAQPPLTALLAKRYKGDWKALRKSLHELAEKRAGRALVEMAIQLRILDDELDISEDLKKRKLPHFGHAIQGDDSVERLYFRDLTNKVVHAAGFEWDLSDPQNPRVIRHPNKKDAKRWQEAVIHLPTLAALVGILED